tara:strand:+ start:466 stop:1020 length:555 start_codon:yes stop_codon:yes gene_type:complete
MTTSKAITTSKIFNSRLSGVITSAKNIQKNVQELAEFAFNQVIEHGNLTPLRDLMSKTSKVKAIRSNLLEAYIMAHVEGVRKSVDKEGNMKLVTKKGEKINVLARTVEWVDYKKLGDDLINPLAKLSEISLDKKLSAYKDRVSVTTSGVALTTQRALLKAQLAALDFQIKTFTEVEVEVEVEAA